MKEIILSPNLTYYPDIYDLCDQLTAEYYEGAPSRANFTLTSWDLVQEV